MRYNPQKIEKKWQKYWQAKKLYQAKDAAAGKKNYMLLTEFPYPSGNLHMGHWYAFALPDIRARYLRMKGYNVMYPIGFDAFGLPAENAAIKRNIHPRDWTKKNIAFMTGQLQSMGAMFDWPRAVSTIEPDYYRWTQWIFLKMHEKGLAYRAATKANWCPKDKTVLANEQVVDGKCERCDTPVEQKNIEQWMFKITAYADRLIDDIEGLDWPNTTKLAQQNWIGRSQGAKIRFSLTGIPGQKDGKHFVEVFTTRADTLFGVTAVVVSPELVQKWIGVGWKASPEVTAYIRKAMGKRELDRLEQVAEKTGVPAGIFAINPANDEKVPVWVADYVLGSYGTGAVMMVPAHDERDFEFAKKFNLPIKKVVVPSAVNVNPFVGPGEAASAQKRVLRAESECFTGDGELVYSGEFSGLLSAEARKKIVEHLKQRGSAEFQKNYRLRDWILSRQRYWGVPIPMIKCATCGFVPVPEKDLPVKLPPLKDFLPTDDGRSPLAKASSWARVRCPKCKEWAERETDTMDTFVDSSWYFFRYTDPKNKKKFADAKKMKSWLPVPMYIGGAEHNTMHLLYSRFFSKVLYDLGYLPALDRTKGDPFFARRNHGIVLGPDGQKMSKSRGNVIDPDKEVVQYGADTVRMYLAFVGPYEQNVVWDPKGIAGVYRFLNRVWNLIHRSTDKKLPVVSADASVPILHRTLKELSEDIETLQFNTGVSGLMKMLNALEAATGGTHKLSAADAGMLLTMLAPFAPHIAEELWMTALKKKKSVHLEKWPKLEAAYLVQDTIDMPVQVNGKVRDVLKVPADASEDQLKQLALASDAVKKHLDGKPAKKVIIVPKRLISIVV